jgi:hypothetical protein
VLLRQGSGWSVRLDGDAAFREFLNNRGSARVAFRGERGYVGGEAVELCAELPALLDGRLLIRARELEVPALPGELDGLEASPTCYLKTAPRGR